MNMEIEKAIDKIAEKFGIALDWSQDNIYPCIRDILQRYRTVSIVQDAVTIVLLVLSVILTTLALKHIFKQIISADDSADDDDDDDFISTIIIAVCIVWLLISVLVTIVNIYDITGWIFVPEMQFVKELAKLK